MTRARFSTRQRTQGFTLIEVMISLIVISVGALGIFSLHGATTRGNKEARQLSVATERSHVWLERMQRDALRWNTQGATPANRINTLYLQNIDSTWRAPTVAVAAEQPGADWQGFDTDGAIRPRVYCTHTRLSWAIVGEVIRADVRTYYHKREGNSRGLIANCGVGTEADATAAITGPDLRTVHASTLIRWSPL